MALLFEPGFDEAVEVAVEDGIGLAGFGVGAVVLDHGVGLEDVGADLVAPGDFAFFAVEFFHFAAFFVLLEFVEFGAEDFHGLVAVGELAALGLAGDDDAGGLVGDAYGAVGFVDVLPAGAAGAEGVDT